MYWNQCTIHHSMLWHGTESNRIVSVCVCGGLVHVCRIIMEDDFYLNSEHTSLSVCQTVHFVSFLFSFISFSRQVHSRATFVRLSCGAVRSHHQSHTNQDRQLWLYALAHIQLTFNGHSNRHRKWTINEKITFSVGKNRFFPRPSRCVPCILPMHSHWPFIHIINLNTKNLRTKNELN